MMPLVDLAYGSLFVLGTLALSLGVYLGAWRLSRAAHLDRHPELAGAMVFRIGALHGLILALVFAQEMAQYQRLELQTASEASAVADIYNDAERYGVGLDDLRVTMVEYVRTVIDTEWQTMATQSQLSPEAWTLWSTAYGMVLDLTPSSPRQTSLREHMLSQLHAIATARNLREADGNGAIMTLFWIAALVGVTLLSLGFYSHRPARHNLVLMGLFAAYTGLVLFMIYGFSNPYAAPGALEPAPFERLYAAIGPAAD